jgi:hypothetical protein
MALRVTSPATLAACLLSVPAAAEPHGELGPFAWNVSDGIVYEDASRELRVDLEGRGALDYVQWDDRNARSRQLRVDRALIGAHADLGRYTDVRVIADPIGTDSPANLWEAWASLSPGRYARVTAGLMPISFGVEHSLGEAAQGLPGRPGFLAFLTGRTDVALRLDGELGDGLLYYDLTGALGEGFDLFGQRRGDPQLSGRVMSHPLRFLDWSVDLGPYRFPLVSGLFASFGWAYSDEFDGHLDVATPLRNKLFDVPRLDGEDASFWVFGYGVDLGPVRVIHEMTRGSLGGVLLPPPSAAREDFDDQITSWQLVVSWRVTGEPYDSRLFDRRDALRPDPPARPITDGGIGALELAFRYANADMDRDLFLAGFTSEGISSQEFRQVVGAVNWDPTASLRVSVEVVRILADGFPAVFDSHGRDTSYLLRAELHF